MAEREKVIKGLTECTRKGIQDERCENCCPYFFCTSCINTLMTDALELLNKQQAEIDRLKAEQPKIIRCKDCKWGVNIGYGWYVCRMLVSGKHLGDWYCADSKAKDGEQE